MWWLLRQGMPWDLALAAADWTGASEELRALARRVAVIREEMEPPPDPGWRR